MSGENEAGSSSKSESTEPDCNAENLLTSSTNYGSTDDITSAVAAVGPTFQSSQGNSIDHQLAVAGIKNGKPSPASILARPSIPNLIAAAAAAAAASENSKMINNNNNSTNNNNNNLPTPNKKLFECDVCNMKFSNGANMR